MDTVMPAGQNIIQTKNKKIEIYQKVAYLRRDDKEK